MHCRKCGAYMEGVAVCPRCGEGRDGARYCTYCSRSLPDNAAFCPGCGAQVNTVPPYYNGSIYGTKSRIAAGVFGIVLGAFGVHNFYLGYTSSRAAANYGPVPWDFVLCVRAIWGLVEGITILSSREYYDAQGYLLRD